MPEYSPHQKKIINRYYEHRDQILLARLQEIVTELFLADSEGKRKQLWTRAGKALDGLKVPAALKSRILAAQSPEILAEALKDLLKGPPPARK